MNREQTHSWDRHQRAAGLAEPLRLCVCGVEPRDQRGSICRLLERVLPDATRNSIERFVDGAKVKSVAPGEVILHQGEPVSITLVIHGFVALRRTTTSGRELILGIANAGSLLGYVGIAGQAASADLVAITPTRIALWSGAYVRERLAADPGLALGIVDGMARFNAAISQRFDGFIHQDARERVLRVLAEYGSLFSGDPPTLSRSLLPGLVGTSREMTGRVIRGLEREGLIARVGRRGLRLLRPVPVDDGPEPAAFAS